MKEMFSDCAEPGLPATSRPLTKTSTLSNKTMRSPLSSSHEQARNTADSMAQTADKIKKDRAALITQAVILPPLVGPFQ
jgi:hypothetical protein